MNENNTPLENESNTSTSENETINSSEEVVKQEVLVEEMEEPPKGQDETGKVIEMIPDNKVKEEPEQTVFDAREYSVPKANALTDELSLNFQRINSRGYIELFKELSKIPDAFTGGKWAHFVNRNGDLFMSVINASSKWINKNQPKSERISEFNSKELALLMKYSTKDDMGNPNMKENRFDDPDDKKEELKQERELLDKEYEDVLPTIKEFNVKQQIYLNEEVVIKPYLILRSNIPAGVYPDMLASIESFIVED